MLTNIWLLLYNLAVLKSEENIEKNNIFNASFKLWRT